MHKVKVSYMGKRLKDIYPHATKWQVFKYRVKVFFWVLFIGLMIMGVLVGIFEAGSYFNPAIIYTKAEVIKEVPIKASVMERIAKCESGNDQFDSTGQVQLNANTNKTVDIGVFQINNKVWGKKATELGYNLMVEQDNRAMAQYIYESRGTEPWSASSKCWSK